MQIQVGVEGQRRREGERESERMEGGREREREMRG